LPGHGNTSINAIEDGEGQHVKNSSEGAGLMFDSQIIAVEDQIAEEDDGPVYPCSPNMELNNWENIEFLVVFNLFSK